MRQIHVAKRLPKADSLPQTPLPPDPRDMDASARLWLAQPTAREARSEAVFASTLQPSDTPTADMIASAISRAVQRLGTRGCAETMAQEFGDHPDVAAERMRWARQLAA